MIRPNFYFEKCRISGKHFKTLKHAHQLTFVIVNELIVLEDRVSVFQATALWVSFASCNTQQLQKTSTIQLNLTQESVVNGPRGWSRKTSAGIWKRWVGTQLLSGVSNDIKLFKWDFLRWPLGDCVLQTWQLFLCLVSQFQNNGGNMLWPFESKGESSSCVTHPSLIFWT